MTFDRWAGELADHIAKQRRSETRFDCDTCEDTGTHIDMRCYGGPPVEITVYCIDCGGARAGDPVDDGIRDSR